MLALSLIHISGTDVIRVEGVKSLKGAEYLVMPDRIEVGTFMAAAAITAGEICITNAVAEHVQACLLYTSRCV